MPNLYPPIDRQAFDDLVTWFIHRRLGGDPDPQRLCHPQGPIIEATPREGDAIDFVLSDQMEPTRMRNPRTLDAVSYCALKAVLIPGAHVMISRTDKAPRPEKHYVTIFDHIKLGRIIADALPGEVVRQHGDHHDLQRGLLYKVAVTPSATSGYTWKGRPLAIDSMLANFDKANLDHLPLNRAGLEWLAREAFALVDQIPLGKAP